MITDKPLKPQSVATKPSFWQQGLGKTRLLFEKIGIAGAPWSNNDFAACEDALIQADVGISATESLILQLHKLPNKSLPIQDALRHAIINMVQPLVFDASKNINVADKDASESSDAKPKVIMMTGINGSGKTTTIAKLTQYFLSEKKSVLLAAADTFRAAAREQLKHWGERAEVRVIEQEGGDPAAVAFSAIQSATAQHNDIVLIDTAGRLPTQKNLMAELARIHRICNKAMVGAPHEVWLVLDGTQGQNTLAQIRQFHESVPISGLIITKLDGSAKGGFICALAHAACMSTNSKTPVMPLIPVRFIGVGEKPEDLQVFSAEGFAAGML